ncbi:hypothetical protein ARMGADRAFT_568915 [Armillaria gallica]|uniref:Uncharacterized protein n=1 Tax=Armillaria gallica TaxID=47427 RepID=A0A2H3E4P9_ARMGA|nr:hypothetical protein ARMGADRAFT_568915 [Armillaria gallica]
MVAWSANIRLGYLATSDKRAQNPGAAVHLHPIQTRLPRAIQPACPSDIVAVVCPLFMPLSAFRIPAPYLPLAALKMTRSHRADFATRKYTRECLVALAAHGCQDTLLITTLHVIDTTWQRKFSRRNCSFNDL